MIYPINLRSKLFYVPLILGSLVASFYLIGIIFNFLGNFSSIFTILITAWIVSIILKPVVNALKKRGVSNLLAIIISFLLLFIVIAMIGLFVFPPLYSELNTIAVKLARFNLNRYLVPIVDYLHLHNINVSNINITNTILSNVNQFVGYALNNSVAFVGNFFSIFFNLILSFFFAFYFLSEGKSWKHEIIKLLPDSVRPDFILVSDSINDGIQGFIKGQAIIAFLMAAAVMIIMRILGLNLIVVAGLYVFITMMIPVVGPVISVIVPLLIAATASFTLFIILFVCIFTISQVIVNLVQPRVLSKSLGLHPVLVVLAVLVGAQLFGFVGALLALPAASIIQSLLIHYYKDR